MAVTVTLSSDFTDVITLAQASPARIVKAIARSINRALGSARTVMVRAVATETGLKSSDLRVAMPLRQATTSRLVGDLSAPMKRITLIDFRARQTKHGVSYKLLSGRNLVPNAFIATMASGHTGVFVRKGKARLPIHELQGPSLGRVFQKYEPDGQAKAQESLETNLAHELEFVGAGVDLNTSITVSDDDE